MNTSHYPSLELCKKLTEIGFPNTEKYITHGISNIINSVHDEFGPMIFKEKQMSRCPNVMEMLDVIPNYITNTKWEFGYNLEIFRQVFDFHGYFVNYVNGKQIKYVTIGPLPNALAEMVLWLHANGHIKFS